MPKSESAFAKYPEYRVELIRREKRIRVSFAGEILVDTEGALEVLETRHAPVLYFPRDDARMDLFERTDHHTFCPFKGEASYFSLRVGEQAAENAVWTYEDPFAEVAGLANRLAFYADRVEILEDA
jgi:uncharacterized protein (DUF427 family)